MSYSKPFSRKLLRIKMRGPCQVHGDAGFGVGLGRLSVALLMVELNIEFPLKFLVSKFWRQVVVLQPTVDGAANLFHCQSPLGRFVEFETDAATKKKAQARHEVMPMDTSPPADFKMIHAEFFFAHSELRFNRPASEGHTKQFAKRHAVLAHHGIGQKELCLPCAHAAGNDQSLAFARQALLGLTPDRHVLDLPDFRPFVGVFDSVLLPRLAVEL